MKTSQILGIATLCLILIAGTLILLTMSQSMVSAQEINASAVHAQVTATPATDDNSVIGSTDGIVVMGILIVVIVITPVLLRRKKK